VRNVGGNVVESLKVSRQDKGRFTSFVDFLSKVDVQVCNKRVIESLIKAGAFDSLGHTRRGLLTVHIEALDSVLDTKRAEAVGQFDLFGSAEDAPTGSLSGVELNISDEEWDKRTLLAQEREMLGLYVSDHPLLGLEQVLSLHATMSTAGVADATSGTSATFAGLISEVQLKTSKKSGERWAIVVLEDLDGMVEVMLWAKTYTKFAHLLTEDAVVSMAVRIDKRDEEEPRVALVNMSVLDTANAQNGPVTVYIPERRITPGVMESLRNVLASHPGTTQVHLVLVLEGSTTAVRADDKLRVRVSTSLFADLKALLGPACLDAPESEQFARA